MWKSFFIICFFTVVVSFAGSQEAERRFPPGALLVVAYRGDVETMREILAEDHDKNIRDATGATALHVAALQQNPAMIRLLLENGFDPNAVAAGNGYTPLHSAVAANNVDAARLLLQYGADRNIKNLNGHTPYQKAVNEEKRQLYLLLFR